MERVFYPEDDVRLVGEGRCAFSGALLVADISGFTKMTETLASSGREGVEELTSLLNRCFDPMLNTVRARGGSVITFSGDSILVRFTGEKDASGCAAELLEGMEGFRDVELLGRSFSIMSKVVVGAGGWNQYIVGCPERAHLVLTGGLVRELAEREERAAPGSRATFFRGQEPSCSYPASPETRPSSFVSPGSGRVHGERRPVTPVFMNIAPLEGEEIEYPAFQELYLDILGTVKNHGGFVHHVDSLVASGARIMTLFGAPVSSGMDTENGILAALETVGRHAGRRDIRIGCGIDCGYVYSGITGNEWRKQYTVIGDAVNTACRLADAAGPGLVTVSSRAASAAGDRIRYGRPVKVSLKGKSKAVTALHAIGRETEGLFGSFIGRGEEVEKLLEMVHQGGAPVIVAGKAGIGKTTLMMELGKMLENRGYRVLRGARRRYGSPYGMLADLLREACGTHERSSDETALRELDSLLETAADPELSRRRVFLGRMLLRLEIQDAGFERLPPQLRRENLMDALVLLLGSFGRKTCVMIEDLHYAGEDELDFLTTMAERASRKVGCSFFLSTRPEGLEKLPSDMEPRRFDLEGMDAGESSELLFEYAGRHPVDDEVVGLITEKAQGNPFFLVQFLLYLIENGLLELRTGTWTRSGPDCFEELPENVFSMIMARIDTLEEKARESLKVASVIGLRFREPLLRGALERDVHSDLSESERAGLTYLNSIAELEYIFSHMLIRDVAYSSILRERKKQLHRTIGTLLEDMSEEDRCPPDLLARHFRNGEVWDRAVEYSMKAGELAVSEYRNRDALSLYESAVAIIDEHFPEGHESLAECLHRAGEIHDTMGNLDEAVACLQRAVSCARDNSEKQKSLMSIANVRFNQGRIEEGLEGICEIERMLEQSNVDSSDMRLQTAAYRAWTDCIRGDLDEAERQAREAVRLGESLEGYTGLQKAQRLGHALNTLATVHWARADYQTAMELYERAINIALEKGLKREAAITLGNISLTNDRLGNYEKAVEGIRRKLEIGLEIGEKFIVQSAYGELGSALTTLGRFDEAIQCLSMRRELAETMGVAHDTVLAMNHLAKVRLIRGELDEAEGLLEKSLSILDRREVERERGYTLFVSGLLAAERGDTTLALERLEEAARLSEEFQSHSLAHRILIERAGILMSSDDLLEAEKAVEESFEIAEKTEESLALALSGMARGRLLHLKGEHIEAAAELRKAAEMFEAMGTVYDLALALRYLAVVSNDAETMERARDLFAGMGLQKHAEECADGIPGERPEHSPHP